MLQRAAIKQRLNMSSVFHNAHFRGHMRADNRAGGGAELIVELPRLTLDATLEKAVNA